MDITLSFWGKLFEQPISSAVLSQYPLYLEIEVDTNGPLNPRGIKPNPVYILAEPFKNCWRSSECHRSRYRWEPRYRWQWFGLGRH